MGSNLFAKLWKWWSKGRHLEKCIAEANSRGFTDDWILRNHIVDLMEKRGYNFSRDSGTSDHLDPKSYTVKWRDFLDFMTWRSASTPRTIAQALILPSSMGLDAKAVDEALLRAPRRLVQLR